MDLFFITISLVSNINMKFLLCIFALVAVATAQVVDIDNRMSLQELVAQLRMEQKFQQVSEKFEEVCPGRGDDIKEGLWAVVKCESEIEKKNETICTSIKNHFMECTKQVRGVMRDCVPAHSKDIPDLVFNSITRGFAHVCRMDGEHIFELGNKCISKNLESRSTSTCLRRVMTKMQEYTKNTPTKGQLCQFASSLKGCLQIHLSNSCQNPITQEAFIGFYDAILTTCNQYNYVDSNDLVERF
ncbi:uncharacterized protein LOC109597125 [Aethina tumida]|uniref:uncharacterized protein LOC109597125 n=1 Tax=Aethina tumida TaxID=116153 RepID=UPI00096ADEC5|nr:uncharacterized protein LOC109597125 [Aethina tumida]XP_019868316.1 uncharacterized protein LOC109597125 [Aethina tumida]